MSPLNSPPDEEWWERQLLRNEKKAIALQERFRGDPRRDLPPAPPEDLCDDEDLPYLPELDETEDTDYRALATAAMEFSVAAMRVDRYPVGFEEVRYAALRVTTHLAGGHGIGYDDGALCGNIVKCRWALAEAQFCREGLETLVNIRRRPEFAGLLVRCRALIPVIEDRIHHLRERVWW